MRAVKVHPANNCCTSLVLAMLAILCARSWRECVMGMSFVAVLLIIKEVSRRHRWAAMRLE